jgi:hypothetical protein
MESAAPWILGGFVARPFRSILPLPHSLSDNELFAAGSRPGFRSQSEES